MARFIGLILMLITGAVVADLTVRLLDGPASTATGLALALLPMGLLFGFLDSDRHYIWSIVGALVVAGVLIKGSQAVDGAVVTDRMQAPIKPHLIHHVVPILALLSGSFLGARIITSRVRAATRPHEEAD